jgi:transglutaminase-like putative cysteine protease
MQTLSLITTRGKGVPTLAQLRKGKRRLVQQDIPYPGMKPSVQVIKKMIEQYRNAEFVRKLARELTRHIPKDPRSGHPDMRNYDAIAKAIYDHIVRHDVYTNDPAGVERLQAPDATILTGAGDCDDMAILSASLLESIGVPARIRLIGETPDTFSHIFIQYQSEGRWKSFDPTLALYPGYRFDPARIKKSKIIPIEGSSGTGLRHQLSAGPKRSVHSAFIH